MCGQYHDERFLLLCSFWVVRRVAPPPPLGCRAPSCGSRFSGIVFPRRSPVADPPMYSVLLVLRVHWRPYRKLWPSEIWANQNLGAKGDPPGHFVHTVPGGIFEECSPFFPPTAIFPPVYLRTKRAPAMPVGCSPRLVPPDGPWHLPAAARPPAEGVPAGARSMEAAERTRPRRCAESPDGGHFSVLI